MMTLGQKEILAALKDAASRLVMASDWRKRSDGRIVRFIDWRAARKFLHW